MNDAFIVDRPTKEKLIEDDQKSVELIKPFWEGKDIQRWNSDNNDKYVVVIKQGFTKALFGDLSELEAYSAMLEKFPAVMRHLSAYEIASKERSDKGDYWWEMRSCAYYNLFEQPKITWANLQSRGKFCWDDSGKYINAPAVILPTDDKALLGVLNSSLVWFYLTGICVARSGGYLEIKPQYFSQIPVPSIPEDVRGDLATLVNANINATKEAQEKTLRFKKLVTAEFKIEKWGRNLSKWWTLDFTQFSKALGVKKLPLAQKDDLLTLYDKYRAELIDLSDKIKKADDQIDTLVFDLYQLTSDEIKIVKDNSSGGESEEAQES